MSKTLDYYNANADKFIAGTVSVDFKQVRDKFLGYLPEHALILNLGCGSGHDTKWFMEQGYPVDAVDGSEELCKAATEYTGIEVKQMLFRDLNVADKYDGIWACSSILHLPKAELLDVISKMIRARELLGNLLPSSSQCGDSDS
jgi:2-polyprenyl-3-methyl-5-hydroxy-6-metoxy-1,4-benzoquinol methylase